MTPDESLDGFFDGKNSLFFFVPSNCSADSLTSLDFVKRKDQRGLGIVCWGSEQGAMAFLSKHDDLKETKAIELTLEKLNQVLERSDPLRREFDGFICEPD